MRYLSLRCVAIHVTILTTSTILLYWCLSFRTANAVSYLLFLIFLVRVTHILNGSYTYGRIEGLKDIADHHKEG
jgi:hypothetical protein